MSSVSVALDHAFSIAADVALRRPPATTPSFAIPGVRPATALEIRPAPEMVPFGIAALDELTGGVPRGCLTEMVGSSSSGRTSVMMSLMAEVTRRQEVCALIDATDSFDPASAEKAGVDLKRVLWVRCGKERSQESGVRSQKSAVPLVPAFASNVSNAEQVHQAITTGCFETARGRREITMQQVAPPAKNISWSIHQNYDARLRHRMLNGSEEERFTPAKPRTMQAAPQAPRPTPQLAMKNAVQARAAKWNRLDQALKAADLLLQSGGFGLILVDLGDIAPEQARRIPLTSWFRFRRVVENTPTIFMVMARISCAKTCASLVMNFHAEPLRSGKEESGVRSRESAVVPLTHTSLLDGLNIHVEVARTRLERKPVRSASAHLETQTAWKQTG